MKFFLIFLMISVLGCAATIKKDETGIRFTPDSISYDIEAGPVKSIGSVEIPFGELVVNWVGVALDETLSLFDQVIKWSTRNDDST